MHLSFTKLSLEVRLRRTKLFMQFGPSCEPLRGSCMVLRTKSGLRPAQRLQRSQWVNLIAQESVNSYSPSHNSNNSQNSPSQNSQKSQNSPFLYIGSIIIRKTRHIRRSQNSNFRHFRRWHLSFILSDSPIKLPYPSFEPTTIN